jgi:hypothetical protein
MQRSFGTARELVELRYYARRDAEELAAAAPERAPVGSVTHALKGEAPAYFER